VAFGKLGLGGGGDMPPFSFYVGERKLMTHSRSHELYDLESHALQVSNDQILIFLHLGES
jgi:hypothetical protein